MKTAPEPIIEEKRVRLAEACGWVKRTVTDEESRFYGTPMDTEFWNAPGQNREDDDMEPPDYFADLNACHEAENMLTEELQKSNYEFCLREEVAKSRDGILGEDLRDFSIITATSEQRAEALGRTLNLWS